MAAQERAIPFWPDEVPAAIHAQVDGNAALETVRELSRFHRVHGSPGFAAAAELIKKKLLAAGLADAAIEHFPADGKTAYAHFRSYYGWNPVSATLEEVSPRPHLIESFPDLPVALADYSQNADVTGELVDAGRGAQAKDYEGMAIKGKIVLAGGPLPLVHRLACEERGAEGFLSDFPNQTTAWSGDDRDLVRWGHLSPYQTANRFAFMLSRRQAEDLRARLAAGERITLRARVAAKMVPATFDVVVATIPGTEAAAGEVVLTAHLCHESAGANDNASGSAAILEIARALQSAIRNQPENLDPTKLGRVAYLGAGIAWTLAALPDTEAPRLLALVSAHAGERVAAARARAVGDPVEGGLFEREAVAEGIETLRSVAVLFPSVAAGARDAEARLASTRLAAVPPGARDNRIPVRSPDVRGPLGVYYYDHLSEVLGSGVRATTALVEREHGDVLAWETLNLVDGKRTISDIRDVLTGRYEPVRPAEISEYLDLLAKAKVVSFR